MRQALLNQYADELYRSLADRRPIAPLTERDPDLSLEEAYQIQMRVLARRLDADGEKVIGKKIGVTSRVVMDLLKVDQPDFGHLTSGMLREDGAAIEAASLIAPKAEGEIAFVLKHELAGPGVTVADVLRATEFVVPCFEIVDSRIADWKIRIQDTVADNASSALFVLGDAAVDPRRLDLGVVGMTLEVNGEIAATGAGAAALGHPANAVAWLANTLGRLEMPLKAGEVILSGSLSTMLPVKAGDNLRIGIGGIGSAGVRFV
ncbi:4-oxo-4-pentenoate hydratase, XylJ [Azotobacter vinelandii CA]|uniref:4-oxo-4-pentenoate hydratase, XylJ n=2 Tax=Azotobacter vinelandii TaxID=354 RepID=C1DMS8_AZOVD|nr:2-oxopent-4-enoate hydratase [Azotobacter vinelandii]ACO77108.1 4-oxo-4-pentenoate hydratase, XylJ [Azotobacter vinelandii DJ]AGK14090.1 4-oxo-4-pentenoate hydratase, XylJ [Azotobacter vinelandii CA]AGK18984.1 4-oxo-4-pentenoate hydratase, XylJ [Azotobacter vinelandii CA6]WKN22832.1 2-oxopent-4-enoate hydratase [Azotobacter vinelandii]SFX94762.1 2-oxopent-4-enoate/cis-2-oxohex-4-enoate hydratase [Azotobacter vinelandii]